LTAGGPLALIAEVHRLSVAEAQAETNKAAAKAHVESMKKRTQ
jgi:hypothetical protein